MRCQLCSFEYDEKQIVCHSSCAFNKHCTVICCPNCGFQSPDESRSRLAIGAKKFFSYFHRQTDSPPITMTCPLSQLHQGQAGKVITIDTTNATRLERLHIFGLIPGAKVILEQSSPEFILRVDYTTLTIERAIADDIMIEVVQ